ncbi:MULTISPECIES: WD40 repeat domain-containing serine/threonine protein kinase [Chloracidobacterium]|jgi:serine/threonine protein kinase|uniref:non-specific serine/threonine protein kinase n=1 Tax=Chloracidobacterium thermophilum (strain B) TaxID=981222 RepID=G2LGZ1_CHLTF|nr:MULTISPECIES: serine/threonine-protein kinase [Chloracidobacterium]AEP11491.1 Serine/threonine protein kinase/ WD40 repeat protein [Chloracidobacterium thermophilum B]QUV79387.1 serine/threonine protein kinase [Chloracidobacterium thermophilum]QUV82421.1 serine/threonine protein kinase [Chloracidobacterium sp. D]
MRYCPLCKQCYDDTELRCTKDGAFLAEAFPGARIISGKYRLDALIGQGGMGSVYRATHLELDRTIALKIVLPDFVSNHETLERFRQEARAAARLNHPNVISVYDFGILPTGQAYLAMELLTGHSLREELERHERLSPQRIVSILRPVCQAIHAAHEAGVVHRDIKPDNIILLSKPETGEEIVKVVDFGIAKLKERPGTTVSNLTEPGLVMGTPHYMSPEQCRGEELDRTSDIYSLGVTLYELLVGHVPFDAPTPSAVIIQHAVDPPPLMRRLRPDIPEEIERVVLRALSKVREQRQPTALRLYQEFEQALREAEETAAALNIAKISATFPTLDLSQMKPVELKLVATLTGHEHIVKSLSYHGSGDWLASASGDGSVRLWDLRTNREIGLFSGHEYSVNAVAIAPDGLRLASGGADGTARLWTLRDATEIASFGHRTAVRALLFASDGRWLITAFDTEVKIWDALRQRQIASFLGHIKTIDALALSPDGHTLASGGADDAIHFWDLISKTEQAMLRLSGHAPTSLVYLPDGRLISGGRDGQLCLWHTTETGPLQTVEAHLEAIRALALSPDGRWLASSDWNGVIKLWATQDFTNLVTVEAHDGAAQSLAFAPDGQHLASGGADALIHLWQLTVIAD